MFETQKYVALVVLFTIVSSFAARGFVRGLGADMQRENARVRACVMMR